MSQTQRQFIGRIGEDAVASRYAEMGFSVVARNLHVSRNEIDLILQENGILYPIEIKMSTMPKASMASEFDVLDGVPDKKRGMGAIVCLLDRKMYLRENLVALPLEYL